MSAPNADYYARLARERIAEGKAKFHAAEQKPERDDDEAQHAQAARDALRATKEDA